MLCHLSLGHVNGAVYSSLSVCSPLCLSALGAALRPLFALTCSCPSLLGDTWLCTPQLDMATVLGTWLTLLYD